MIALFVGATIITGLGLEKAIDGRTSDIRAETGVREVWASSALGDGFEGLGSGLSQVPSPAPVFEIANSGGNQEEPVSDPPVLVPAPPAPPSVPRTVTVVLTIYVCENAPPGQSYCGTMASGKRVYEGAAACGYGLALGTRFRLDREYVCEDRGNGPAYWVDIFHWDYYAGQAWRKQYGETVEIEVIDG